MRQATTETVEELKKRKEVTTWRKLAAELGFAKEGFHATLATVANRGVASLDMENQIRAALGLPAVTESGNPKREETRHRWTATAEQERQRLESGLTSTEFIQMLIEKG